MLVFMARLPKPFSRNSSQAHRIRNELLKHSSYGVVLNDFRRLHMSGGSFVVLKRHLNSLILALVLCNDEET
jgi:hypothetical protein